MTLSGYLTSKSVFDQQGCRALTFALARLSCLPSDCYDYYFNFNVFLASMDDAVQAILGHGIDNHLLGLRQIAEQCGKKIPELFLDNAYKTSNHFTLSTSQVKPGRLQTTRRCLVWILIHSQRHTYLITYIILKTRIYTQHQKVASVTSGVTVT